MLKGLRTVVIPVGDLAAAKAWYARVTGVQPYFDEPFYVGFDIGGYELGLHPDEPEGAQPIAYWGVDNIEEAVRSLVEAGATPDREIQDVGEGIKVATIRDPEGNIIGVIENPHFQARG